MKTAIERATAILGGRAEAERPIGPLTTYRLGGPAALLLHAAGEEDLQLAKKVISETGLPVLTIGKGSNVLVADRGFAGLVIVLGEAFARVEIDGLMVRAGAATPLPVLARKTAAAGLHGLEWAVGVPGSVGGALRMNAGGHGSQTSERLAEFTMVDLSGGEDGAFAAARLGHRYRGSDLESHHVVVSALYELEAGDVETAEAEISSIVKWRREHQPGGRNAGSVFTNPSGDSAGRLIDAAGLRGLRVGSASVSDKHANFIQSDEGGTAADVLALMTEVRRRVEQATGVALVPEIRLWGFTAEEMAGLR